jgi:hypothetical protein
MLLDELVEAEHPRLADLLPELDHLLTGNPLAQSRQMARQQQRLLDPLELLTDNDAYYLSDGGYSRVLVNADSRLALSGVSRTAVKQRWNDAAVQHIVRQIDLILTATEQSEKSSQ